MSSADQPLPQLFGQLSGLPDAANNAPDPMATQTLGQTLNQQFPVQQPQQPTPVPAQQQAPQQTGPPKARPILFDFIQGILSPHTQNLVANRPTTRTDVLESFLGNFVQALGQGFANEGHGPGAALRGAGAAMGAPYQEALQRYQLGQQAQLNQAELAQRQAQTGLTQQQAAFLPTQQQAQLQAMSAQPRWDPNTREFIGTMTDAAFANYVKGQGAAKQNALSKQAQADLAAGKVAKYLPTPDGRYLALDAKGLPLHVVDGTIDPAMLQRVSTTQQWLPDGAGGFISAPKTTVSGVQAPTATQPTQGSGLQQAAQNIQGLQGPTALQSAAQKIPGLAAALNKPQPQKPRQIYGNGSIFAYDPQSNERVLTTPAEAAQKGYTNPVPVKEGEIDKYRSAQVQFNDIQANLSRYVAAAHRFAQEGQGADAIGINAALNEAKIGGGIHLGPAGIEIPGYSSLAEAADRVARSEAYGKLSDAGKDLVDGYFRTMSAVPAYMKALTGVGKFNKEVVELELRNIADPTYKPSDILRKLTAFQENVSQGAAGIPRIPGIPTLADTRTKFEGPSSAPLPADVQQLLNTKWSNQ